MSTKRHFKAGFKLPRESLYFSCWRQLYLQGIAWCKMFWVLKFSFFFNVYSSLRLRLLSACANRQRLKLALGWAQNIFMSKNINSITIIVTLEGIDQKNINKTVWTILRASLSSMASIFPHWKYTIKRSWRKIIKSRHLWLIVQLLNCQFIAGWIKCVLALKPQTLHALRHQPQSDCRCYLPKLRNCSAERLSLKFHIGPRNYTSKPNIHFLNNISAADFISRHTSRLKDFIF